LGSNESMAVEPAFLEKTRHYMNRRIHKCVTARVAAAVLFMIAFLISCVSLSAQTCGEEGISVANIEALLQSGYNRCGVTDDQLIYTIGAVAGQAAVPVLRAFASRGPYQCTNFYDAVETALAKLGDPAAFQYLAERLDVRHLVIVGDDRAISIMMAYFENHRADKLFRYEGDYYSANTLMDIAYGISGGGAYEGTPAIGERRSLPNVPKFPYSSVFDDPAATVPGPTFKDAWINWWEQHKGAPLTVAPFESVKDPFLQCLAREVDWGLPGPLLEIADYGGPEAEEVLRKFPPPTKAMSMGTVQGNLSAALAKLGDQEEFMMIVEKGAMNVPRTLEYIGGKKAVDALVGALVTPLEYASINAAAIAECILTRYPNVKKESAQRNCEKMTTSDREMELGQTFLMRILPRMIKNPPLPVGAPYSPENVEKWRDWWAKNKDTAEFVSVPYSQIN
jgi:hypothetical protein